MEENKKSIKDIVLEKKNGTLSLNEVSFGLAKDSRTNKWCVVELNFDLAANESAKPRIVYEDMDRSTAIEQFKINVARKLMV